MRLHSKTLPPIYGWAATSVCSFLGAYLAIGWYIAFTTIAAVSVYATGVYYSFRRQRLHRLLERQAEADATDLMLGRRSRTIYLSMIGSDATMYAAPLAQLLGDVMPEGGRMEWRYPYLVTVRWAERPELGETKHGESG